MPPKQLKTSMSGDDLLDKMINPVPPKEVPQDKDKDKEKDKDKDKSEVSEEIKKAISKEVTKKMDRAAKKQDELSRLVEESRNETKTEITKISQTLANLSKALLKSSPAPDCEDQEASDKQEAEPCFSSLTWLENSGVDEESSHDEEEHETEHEESLMEGLQSYKISRRIKPAQVVLDAWAKTRKMTSDFQPEDWKKYNEDPNVKLYTMHPGASSFKAPEADPECPPLFKDGKELEKKHQMLQNMTGCCGHIIAEMLVSCDAEMQNMTDAAKDYINPNLEIADPRKEAAECFQAIRGITF